MWKKCFFIPPPQTEKKYPKKWQLFSFFENFTAEFSHFLVTKKMFFLSPKSDYTLQWKFWKTKKSCHFLGIFFQFGGGGDKKNNFHVINKFENFVVWTLPFGNILESAKKKRRMFF